MPYGKKKSAAGGRTIDFDRVYDGMIVPAVERDLGLTCVRSDRIDEPGSIHRRMLTQILEARAAIVDTSFLNPNVFYELGVRHALRRAITVLIQEKNTPMPFNIGGMATIVYTASDKGFEEAGNRIHAYLRNSLNNPSPSDSLVYDALPDLEVVRKQQQVRKYTQTHYRLARFLDSERRRIGFVTGDRRDINVGRIWVNSENTNMQMDTFYGRSTSATLRYLGAEKDAIGAVARDTIGDALRAQIGDRIAVDPMTVIPTTAGALEADNGVKWIFHVASVTGQPLRGYRPVEQIDGCVRAVLRMTNRDPYSGDGISSVLFPIFGTGPGGAPIESTIDVLLDAAIEHLERQGQASRIRDVYFYVWGETDLEICKAVAAKKPGLLAEAADVV
jgi:O-acetyl-ADP-ribose deacetylase (regulator of RNase III)